jgi:hypothetical protein
VLREAAGDQEVFERSQGARDVTRTPGGVNATYDP